MKATILHLMFLFVIVGCTQPTINKVQQAVEMQARSLVDSGLIVNKYVVLSEMAINDSSHIYLIRDSDFPANMDNLEYPSKIIKYKDKYLCFIELDEPQMPIEKVIEMTGYSSNLLEEFGWGERWVLVVSKLGENRMLIDNIFTIKGWISYFDVPELLPYFSGYVKEYPVQMGIMSHDVELNRHPSFLINIDSARTELFNSLEMNFDNMYGQIYLKNNMDSTVHLLSNTEKHYAVVNGQDSLFLTLCDSLPIVLKPNENKLVRYKSIPEQVEFIKKIALEPDPWTYLYGLFCHSSYCLMNANGEDLNQKVMYYDINPFNFKVSVIDESGIRFLILNRGIYNKKEGESKIFKYWSDKWDNTSIPDRDKIFKDLEESYTRNVEEKRHKDQTFTIGELSEHQR